MTAATTLTKPKIDPTINAKIAAIVAELKQVVFKRDDVIHGMIVGRIANLHVVLLGPGGTGKSFLCRSFQDRIEGGKRFEAALDETTDPSRVFGPVDIMALKAGKSRVVTDGMLPEATDAFIDEIMNANGPVKHSLQPILNERLFHNGPDALTVPLRQMVAGTNVNNADTDPSLAPFFDRLHLRFTVGYMGDRDAEANMVGQAIARYSTVGRGAGANLPSTVTLDELDQATAESLDLDVSDHVMNTFLDIREELRSAGIEFSDRRMVEGMAAVLANAWVRNHSDVMVGDLDILAAMWWSLQDQAAQARSIIYATVNPTEKAAMDLLDELDKVQQELDRATADKKLDDEHKRRGGVEAVRNADNILKEAAKHLAAAQAGGTSTERLNEVIVRANQLKVTVGRQVFGLDPTTLAAT